MTEQANVNPEISISSLSLLSDNQWRFLSVMVANPDYNKADGARAVGLEPNTVYKWPDHVDEAIAEARQDVTRAAKEAINQALIEAIRVKIKGVRSQNEVISQKAASEIIEWGIGKAAQPITGKDGGAIQHTLTVERIEGRSD